MKHQQFYFSGKL
ncbi:unnamed protein product, partial [Adineta steineri]